MAIKITLDPGHGRTGNPYPPQKGYYEGTQMWKLANYLKAELEKYGFQVVTTRPKLDDNPSLSARGQLAGNNGSSLFLSLHSNAPASASDTKPTGSVVYYSLTDKNNKVLADKLGNKVSEVMGHYYRGSLTRAGSSGADYYGVIRAAAQSGCKAAFIIEHGFHTNIKDSSFLIADSNLQKLALEEAKVIAQYFGQEKKENPSQVNSGVLYRVQVGAYSVKSNAEAMLKKLKADGYDAFITTSGTPSTPKPEPVKEVKVGSKVKVKNAVTFDNKKFVAYHDLYDVIQVNGDRIVIGIGKTITAAVHKDNLIVQ